MANTKLSSSISTDSQFDQRPPERTDDSSGHVTFDTADDSSLTKLKVDASMASLIMTSHEISSKDDASDRLIAVSSSRKSSLSTVIQAGRSVVASLPGPSSVSGVQVNAVAVSKPPTFLGRSDISPVVSEPEVNFVAPSVNRPRSSFHHIHRRHFTDDSVSGAIALTSRGHSIASEEATSAAKTGDDCTAISSRIGRVSASDIATSAENNINDDDLHHGVSPSSMVQDVRPSPSAAERRLVTSCRTTAFSVEDILSPSKFTGGAPNGVIGNCRSQYSNNPSSQDATFADVRSSNSPSPHHQPTTCPTSLWNPWIHRLDLQLRAANDVAKLDLLRGIGEQDIIIFIIIIIIIIIIITIMVVVVV